MVLSFRRQLVLCGLGTAFVALIFVTPVPIAVVFALAAVVTLLVAVVGHRIREIVIGLRGVSIEALADLKYTTLVEPAPEPIIDPMTGIEPPAAELKAFIEVPEKGVSVTTANDKKVDVFMLSQVPLTVLKNLIELWPDVPAPYDFRDFEYAARRRGPGNFAWYVKFTDRAFWVGYGRGSVKVSPADADPQKCLNDARKHHADLKARYSRGEGADEDATRAYNSLRDAFRRATSLNHTEIEALVKEADEWFTEMKRRLGGDADTAG
jgi:hypothetical protein